MHPPTVASIRQPDAVFGSSHSSDPLVLSSFVSSGFWLGRVERGRGVEREAGEGWRRNAHERCLASGGCFASQLKEMSLHPGIPPATLIIINRSWPLQASPLFASVFNSTMTIIQNSYSRNRASGLFSDPFTRQRLGQSPQTRL